VDPDLADVGFVPRGDFLVPATDDRGHSASMIFRLPPNLLYLAEALVASREFPFTTKAELVRWALWQGLKLLGDITRNRQISNYHSMLQAALSVARVSEQQVQFQRDIEKMCGTIHALMMTGAEKQARKLLAEIIGNIEAIDEEDWRDRYRQALTAKFPHLMSEGGGKSKAKPGSKQGKNRRRG